MSTTTDNTTNSNVVNLGEGIYATPNGDGTYTLSGAGEYNGVWAPADADTPGAQLIEDSGTQFDGTYWVKQ